LARHDVTITAVDTSPEVLRINKERVRSHRVRYVRANIFDWSLSARFDTIFFGFWLTHVPPRRFESFWKLVETSLTPDGRVYFVDNRWYPEYRRGHGPGTEKVGAGIPGSWIASRELNDGRRFEIVKVFYEAGELRRRLEMLGWTGQIVETPRFFIWGDLARRTGAA
jgi:demethylmenaquinone methyltransferase/2-methoxy-6-polyprenyl-1,4-benzoquinol methylase